MSKFVIIALSVFSVVGLYTAYWFQMELEPTFPIIPLGLAFASGVAIREAFSW